MKIATWNVNSIRMRLPRLLEWLKQQEPEILCLQETKVVDENFPLNEIRELGYHCLINGQKTYNGVAILSRSEPDQIIRNLPDDPPETERRFVSAMLDGIRIVNIYAPNGQEVGSPKYSYKLEWYRRLKEYCQNNFDPQAPFLICGDFNIAPEDRDVWDVRKWQDKILFSEPEKEALRNLIGWGLIDTMRLHHQEGGLFTWWDYRAGAFHRNWGLRIDHILVSAPLAKRSLSVVVDREARKGDKPSDHAPVIASFS